MRTKFLKVNLTFLTLLKYIIFMYSILNLMMASIALSYFSLTPVETNKRILEDINPYIDGVLKKLPPTMLKAFDKKNVQLKLKFKSFNNGSQLGDAHLDDEIALDISVLTTLILKQELNSEVKEWSFYKNLKEKTNVLFELPKHKTVKEFLDSLLIHELSHKFDLLALPHMKYLKISLDCIYGILPINSRSCEKVNLTQNHSVSSVKEFLNVAGWPDRGFISGNPTPINSLSDRSPNSYEWTYPEETFAVNMEFFLLDPNFKCKRPALYNFLSEYFDNFIPYQNVKCDSIYPVIVLDSKQLNKKKDDAHPLTLIDLDLNKLYQIHYLFGTENEDNSSESYGHAMIRLVFCSPLRTIVNDECLKDKNYHYVANFKGAVNELSIDFLKGVLGGYQSLLFIEPLTVIEHRYTGLSFRNLESIPIEFNKDPIKNKSAMQNVFKAIIDTHWSYVGDYKFLSNNCAQETFSLLKIGFPYSELFDEYTSLPNKLKEFFINTPNNKIIFSDIDKIEKEGYYFFPSREKKYQESYTFLKSKYLISNNYTDFNSYLYSKAIDRKLLIENTLQLEISHIEKSKIVANFYKLEELIEFKVRTFTYELPLSKISQDDIKDGVLKEYFNEYAFQVVPTRALALNDQYGIPTFEEASLKYQAYLNNKKDEKFKQMAQLLNDFSRELLPPDDFNELTLIHNNLKTLVENYPRQK